MLVLAPSLGNLEGLRPQVYWDQRTMSTGQKKATAETVDWTRFTTLKGYCCTNAFQDIEAKLSVQRDPALYEQTSAITSEVEGLLSSLEGRHIVVPNPREVRTYLLAHPDMIDLTYYAGIAASERLGPETELSLEVYHDPEFDDEYLTIYVRQDTYDEDFLSAIEDIRAGYEMALQDASGWLLLTTDFAAPGLRR